MHAYMFVANVYVIYACTCIKHYFIYTICMHTCMLTLDLFAIYACIYVKYYFIYTVCMHTCMWHKHAWMHTCIHGYYIFVCNICMHTCKALICIVICIHLCNNEMRWRITWKRRASWVHIFTLIHICPFPSRDYFSYRVHEWEGLFFHFHRCIPSLPQ